MDRKTLLAIALCFLILFGWQKLVIEPKHTATTNAVQTQQTMPPQANAPVQAPAGPSAGKPDALTQAKPLENRALEVSTGTAEISSGGKFFSNWNLRDYHQGVSKTSANVDLQTVTAKAGEGELAFDLPELAYLANVQGNLTQEGDQQVWTYEDQNIKLVRRTKASAQSPYVDVVLSADFKAKKPAYAFVSITGQGHENDPEERDRQLVYWTNKSIERVGIEETVKMTDVQTPVKWIGASSRYFLMSFINQAPVEPRALVQPVGARTGRISMVYPVSGNSITIPFRAFFGPKDLDLLRSVDPSLDNTVDFGWFTVIAYPLLRLMKWFYTLFHNYGVSIILLTLLVKIITYPLTYKSMKSMKEMAKLQPQLQKIREKHKDDKEALNREMLNMMKSHGYNPMAGCLPILIQMPVFFALYRVLYGSMELYHQPFALWIADLSAKDPYYVTPVLLSVLMYIQQKMTPNTATDPVQAKMMQFTPLIFGAFMLTLPSGLTLYMLVNAIASIVQQLIMNKKLDTRHVPVLASDGK